MYMFQFALLFSLFVLLDFATPIVPVGQIFEWDDEEEVTEGRRLNTRRQPTRFSPVTKPHPVHAIRTNRLAIPALPANNPPSEWLIPLRRSHVASSESVSPTEDH